MYKERYYRTSVYNSDLIKFEVQHYESDLLICAKTNLKKAARQWLVHYHNQIRNYIDKHPHFEKSLTPLDNDNAAPSIIKTMIKASRKANVGPMAAVAGAIAEFVGKELLKSSAEVIVENGGDIFISVKRKRRIGIFAGAANLYNKLAISIAAKDTPCGICTSSGKIGHSLSFGKTNATIVLAKSTALADSFATAIGNIVSSKEDIPQGLKIAQNNKEISGLIIITGSFLAGYGKVKLDVIDK